MRVRVRVVVPPAPDVAADEADPEVRGRGADGAGGVGQGGGGGSGVRGGAGIGEGRAGGLAEAAHGAAGAPPFLEAGAVEDVLAEDGQEAGCFVHALEADGAGGEFD